MTRKVYVTDLNKITGLRIVCKCGGAAILTKQGIRHQETALLLPDKCPCCHETMPEKDIYTIVNLLFYDIPGLKDFDVCIETEEATTP